MTSPTAVIHDTPARFEHLFITKLKPNPNNPRRIDEKHPSLPGLAESILQQGVLEPILVRDLGDAGYMILAGERRWRAARLAGVEKVPCLVRTCDDQTAFEITVTENLQREDLHWLEEARGVEMMLKNGWDAEGISKHIGKSAAWVHLRAKLATISPKWQKAVEEPDSVLHRWPVAMLELVARLPISTQEEILKEDSWDLQELNTVAELRDHINRAYLLLLKSAPWDLDDEKLLPKAGACSACPKRTSCQEHLFAEVKADTCLDAVCYKAKDTAFSARKVAELKKENPAALVVTDDYSGSKGVLGRSAYDLVKPTQKGAKQAIMLVDGKEPKLVHVATGKTRPGHDTASASSGRGAGGESKPTPPKERLAAFMKRREVAVISIVIKKLGGKDDSASINHWGQVKGASADVTRPPRNVLCALAVAHGVKGEGWSGRDGVWTKYRQLVDMADGGLDEALWREVRQAVVSQLIADKTYRVDLTGAKVIALAVGLDWRGILEGVRDRMPLPKTLAEIFDETGQPRKSVGSPAKAKAGKAGG